MNEHCCKSMKDELTKVCENHEDPFECADHLIFYSEKLNEYGIIIHDGGSSFQEISFCPWCGTVLPESKRDLWFEKLAKLGFSDPSVQDIPKEFATGEWYRKKIH